MDHYHCLRNDGQWADGNVNEHTVVTVYDRVVGLCSEWDNLFRRYSLIHEVDGKKMKARMCG